MRWWIAAMSRPGPVSVWAAANAGMRERIAASRMRVTIARSQSIPTLSQCADKLSSIRQAGIAINERIGGPYAPTGRLREWTLGLEQCLVVLFHTVSVASFGCRES